MIELNSAQLQQSITKLISKENGLNQLLEYTLNSMMYIEREEFLNKNGIKANKANGYRMATAFGNGKVLQLNVPRDRLGMFKPVALELIRLNEKSIKNLTFKLYAKGLSTKEVGDVLDDFYGRHYSKSTISNFSNELKISLEKWRKRPVEKHYHVLYLDCIYEKTNLDGRINALPYFVVIGLTEEYKRDVICIDYMPSEDCNSWEIVLKDLKQRGLESTHLVVADGIAHLENKIHKLFPMARFQKCVTHLKRSWLKYVGKFSKEEFNSDLNVVFDMNNNNDTKDKALKRLDEFIEKWKNKYPKIFRKTTKEIYIYYFTYLDFCMQVRRMIYTTNWIENLNKSFRRVLKMRNSMPSPDSAMSLLSQVAIEKNKDKFDHPIYNFKYESIFKNEN